MAVLSTPANRQILKRWGGQEEEDIPAHPKAQAYVLRTDERDVGWENYPDKRYGSGKCKVFAAMP